MAESNGNYSSSLQKRAIRLLIVIDASRVALLGGEERALQATPALVKKVSDLFSVLPIVPMISVSLSGQIVLRGNDPWPFTALTSLQSSQDARTLLHKFGDLLTAWLDDGFLSSTSFDAYMLLSGLTFQKNQIGMAAVGVLCKGLSDSVVQTAALDDQVVTTVMAHELGHNLGMQHDTGFPLACLTKGFIMQSSTNSESASVFSQCSQVAMVSLFFTWEL
jgi:hypothetical protein